MPGQPAPAPVAAWIASLQWTGAGPAEGALALDEGPAFYHGGDAYRRVVPYFSNLAVAALLDAAPSAEALDVAERWITWSLANGGPHGVPPEWWYPTDGGPGTACPASLPTSPAMSQCDHVDATDSAAATLLDVARAYAQNGGSRLQLEAWLDDLRAVGQTLSALQDADGLTWARSDYPVKYLMDNAETVRGFRSLGVIERRLGHTAESDAAFQKADLAVAGIASLRDAGTGLWAWARHASGADETPSLDNWYADAVAQVWPVLFGAAPRAHAQAGYVALDAAYDGQTRPDWATATPDPSGFDWPAVGMAAVLAGDLDRAHDQVVSLWDRRVAPVGGQPFAPPFTVADAGWLLRVVTETHGGTAARQALVATAEAPAELPAPAGPSLTDLRPNPTVGSASMTLVPTVSGPVTAEVFDLQGRRVATAFQGVADAGVARTISVDAGGLPPGLYLVRVAGSAFVETRRLVVTR